MFSDLPKHEISNAISHFVGVVLSIIGIPIIFVLSLKAGLSASVGIGFFGFGLLVVFSSSTIYHLMTKEKLKILWRKIDHMAIFFLIAGTYTAYILRYLNEEQGMIFLTVHWSIVMLGLVFKFFYCGRFEFLSTSLYLLLGWMAVFIINPLTQEMSKDVLFFVIGGGVAYSIGVIFYVWEKYKINHTIWHVFVLLGSVSHYLGLLYSF